MKTEDKNPGEKTWNNQQEVNEGFSGENLPGENNPSENIVPLMNSEIETDQFGNETEVKRARFPHQHDDAVGFEDNSVIRNEKSLENRDKNYDISTNRYPFSNPEAHKDRGNFDVNES